MPFSPILARKIGLILSTRSGVSCNGLLGGRLHLVQALPFADA
jgi:hypothetical protein